MKHNGKNFIMYIFQLGRRETKFDVKIQLGRRETEKKTNLVKGLSLAN